MVAFDGNNMEAWGFGVLGLKIESITNFESYKLFKPLFNSQDSSDSSEAERCVRIFLKALYQYLKEALRDHLPDQTWDQSKVKFLFSYPTTWDEETQARFSAVVKEAGYQAIEEQLSMTSLDEAEASMMYFFSSAREDTLPKPGEHVLMADVGGGTSDISIYEVSGLEGRQPKLVRVVCDEGKYIGSTQVDEQCKNKLRPKVEDICRQRLQEIPNAQQLDEYAMEKFVDAAVLHIEQNPVYTSHKHRYGKKAVDGRLQRAEFELLFLDPAEPEAGKVSTKTSIPIRIHREEFFEDAFRDQCAKIWDQCKSQMERLKAGQTVKHVVLSGGFGSSPYVMAKLSEKFTEYAKSQKADPPKVRQIADAQIAVCQGLVYDELRNIHGTGLWVYPAAASYGIRKAGKQDGIKWFLKKGDEVKVPHDVNIERHVNIDQSGKAGVLDFKIVKIERPPPTGFVMKTTEKAEWSQHAVPIKDISDWVKESLSGDLKGRLLLPKKAVLTITAKMFRDTIALTLHQANREPSRALYVHEPWHKAPKVNAGRAKAPKLKAWKFNLSKDQMIGLGALAFGAISAIYAVVAVHKGESQSKESQPKKSPPEESQPEESQRPLDKDVKSEETRGGDSEQENTSYDHFAVTTPGDSGLNAADMITTVDEPMMNNQYVFQTGNN
ncbi:hypothetical protein F4860DRAFT_353276 [Xylaria cubensis]|nr:hypothetical protein F4860DRAFT_353276 [Xylaria cubensis]